MAVPTDAVAFAADTPKRPANLLFIMVAAAWLGISFVVLYLPIASDNGSSG